ncbi:zinc finger CCCH-type with G patch domain-containing protein [Chanos chanos]|uniref:Zinc finger CCCH-type with G patch domain-containing protein n=1 Tax=Chanos chanos TaxID=29144 RepID=A0A6J2WT56_CHACN|nr:zinc finger CCCH-type with G patch domain-containing protein [Chanos chanos]
MDEGSLRAAIEAYQIQLQQVEAALCAGVDSAQQTDLLKLKEDILQLIELTESSLVSVKKSQLLASLEESSTPRPVAQETSELSGQRDHLDNEFTVFYSEVAGLSGTASEGGETATHDKVEEDDSDDREEEYEEEEELSGTKVQAPYRSSWGTLEYHNAMVVGSEEPDGDEAQVRVLYLYPTHKAMKPCQFFLEGKCRFMDNCRFSHGEVVHVSELREFLAVDLTALEVGSSCLAKHHDGLWFPAKITDIDGGFYTVKFDSLLLKEAVLEADAVIPPMRQEEQPSSESEDDDGEDFDAAYAKVFNVGKDESCAMASSSALGGWEVHTRGIGSKLMLKMGYEFGKGLGKSLEGRVEPVQALVLPKGRSLDQCAEFTQKKTQAALAKDGSTGTKRKQKKRQISSQKTQHNVFDFLNSKLGDAEPAASPQQSLPTAGKEDAYRGGKTTKKSLNVRLFQAAEKMAQTEKEIQRLTESLKRRNGRDAAVISRLEERLCASRNALQQLKAQEQSIIHQQKKADTHKKMTEF